MWLRTRGRSSFEARLRSHLRMTVVDWWHPPRQPFRILPILTLSISHTFACFHHLSFPRGVGRADRLIFYCRPRTRGAAERREAPHWSSITLARRDAALATRSHPVAIGTTPLGAPPWRFPAAGPRFNSGSVHRIHVATCPRPDRKIGPTGSRTSRAAVRIRSPRDATPRSVCGSSPETPLMSENESCVAWMRYVVNTAVET